MTDWFWDLGFDLTAVVNNGQRLLPNGFVLLTSPPVPATPYGILPGDTIGFNLFNITKSLPAGDIAVTGSITFRNAVTGQTNQTPVSSNGTPITIINFTFPRANSSGYSVIFSGVQAVNPNPSPTSFPAYNIPVPTGLAVANNGRFLISFSITVKVANGSPITFQDDPEMVVGSIF